MGSFKSLASRWQDANGTKAWPTSEELEQFRRQLTDFDRMMEAVVERDRLDWENQPRPAERWEDCPAPREA